MTKRGTYCANVIRASRNLLLGMSSALGMFERQQIAGGSFLKCIRTPANHVGRSHGAVPMVPHFMCQLSCSSAGKTVSLFDTSHTLHICFAIHPLRCRFSRKLAVTSRGSSCVGGGTRWARFPRPMNLASWFRIRFEALSKPSQLAGRSRQMAL